MTTKKRTQTDAKSLAQTLIAQAAQSPRTSDPSATALRELRAVLEHNDAASAHKRVTVAATLEMLESLGWSGGARALNGVCQRLLGRRSYANP